MLQQLKKLTLGVAALAALAVGGAAIVERCLVVDALHDHDDDPDATSPPAAPPFAGPRHGTAAHEDAEKPVTGDAAAKAQAAAVKIVGSGTAGPVTRRGRGRAGPRPRRRRVGTKPAQTRHRSAATFVRWTSSTRC